MTDENFIPHTENVNYLETSPLKMRGSNGKPVKLYRYVGVTGGRDWDSVRKYFFYVTPDFVLENGVTGFEEYSQIDWYCKQKDVFIVEQKLHVPLHLTVGYIARIHRTEAGEWYDRMREQQNNKTEKIKEIKSWFTEAVYPDSTRDYIGDIILSSRAYLSTRENFFDEGGFCFFIREEQDFIAMFVNLEYSRHLGNCSGRLDGIFCYVDFDPDLADLINDWCVDETDEFRDMFVNDRCHYVHDHDPRMFHKPPHEFHSGCTKKRPKDPPMPPHAKHPKHRKMPWQYDLDHY